MQRKLLKEIHSPRSLIFQRYNRSYVKYDIHQRDVELLVKQWSSKVADNQVR